MRINNYVLNCQDEFPFSANCRAINVGNPFLLKCEQLIMFAPFVFNLRGNFFSSVSFQVSYVKAQN